jgi:hypothetical protein
VDFIGDGLGEPGKNKGIDYAPANSYIYILDDDTYILSEFWPTLAAQLQDADGIVFEQLVNNAIRKINVTRGQIDQGQYIAHKSIIKNTRIPNCYDGDGYFIEELYKRGTWKHIDKPLCIYNGLRR